MKITILTLFPKMIYGFVNESILKRAQEKHAVSIEIINIRDFAVDNYGSVDDKPYGGGVGMVMRVEPIYKAIQFAKSKFQISNSKQTLNSTLQKIILTSARGKTYKQTTAQLLSNFDHLIIICGHYEGVDERILHYVDEEISIGDYVLTGGELPACIIADSIIRLLPGVLKHKEATDKESFSHVLPESSTKQYQLTTVLEYPQYTRPEKFMGKTVPKILLSGDHKKIEKWRQKKAFEITEKKRPDLCN